ARRRFPRLHAGERSVAVQLLHPLAALLCLERESRRRPGEKTRNADRLAGLLAIAVGTVVDHLQRLLYFLEQLALPVPGAQLERVFLFERGAVRRIGRDLVLAQVLTGIIGVVQQLR